MKYIITVTESVKKEVVVSADTPEDAIQYAQNAWSIGQIILTKEDIPNTTFMVAGFITEN